MRRGFFFCATAVPFEPKPLRNRCAQKNSSTFFHACCSAITVFESIYHFNRCATVAQRFFEIEFNTSIMSFEFLILNYWMLKTED
jgi:hypothetical protein